MCEWIILTFAPPDRAKVTDLRQVSLSVSPHCTSCPWTTNLNPAESWTHRHNIVTTAAKVRAEHREQRQGNTSDRSDSGWCWGDFWSSQLEAAEERAKTGDQSVFGWGQLLKLDRREWRKPSIFVNTILMDRATYKVTWHHWRPVLLTLWQSCDRRGSLGVSSCKVYPCILNWCGRFQMLHENKVTWSITDHDWKW